MGTSLKRQDELDVVDKLYQSNEITKPIRNERLWEARITFALACCLIVVGAALTVRESLQSPSQILTAKSLVGVLITVIGGFLLRLHKAAHDQLEQIRKDDIAEGMIMRIKDDNERDKALRDYAFNQNQTKSFWKRITGG